MSELSERLLTVSDGIQTLVTQYEDLKMQHAFLVACLAARQIAGVENEVVRDDRNEELNQLALTGRIEVAYCVEKGQGRLEVVDENHMLVHEYPKTGE